MRPNIRSVDFPYHGDIGADALLAGTDGTLSRQRHAVHGLRRLRSGVSFADGPDWSQADASRAGIGLGAVAGVSHGGRASLVQKGVRLGDLKADAVHLV